MTGKEGEFTNHADEDQPRAARTMNEEYLGDGLYASFDGGVVILRAGREDRDHWIALDPDVVIAFRRYLAALARLHPAMASAWAPRAGEE